MNIHDLEEKNRFVVTAVEYTDAGAGNRFAAAVDYTATGLNELKDPPQQKNLVLDKFRRNSTIRKPSRLGVLHHCATAGFPLRKRPEFLLKKPISLGQ